MVCTINGTQDTCQVCSARYNQSLRTSSYTMERCKSWPLDDKCSNGKSKFTLYSPTVYIDQYLSSLCGDCFVYFFLQETVQLMMT